MIRGSDVQWHHEGTVLICFDGDGQLFSAIIPQAEADDILVRAALLDAYNAGISWGYDAGKARVAGDMRRLIKV